MEDGQLATITGDSYADAPNSFVIGWSPKGEGVAVLESGACGLGALEPGVYLASGPGDLRLLYPTGDLVPVARIWGDLPGS